MVPYTEAEKAVWNELVQEASGLYPASKGNYYEGWGLGAIVSKLFFDAVEAAFLKNWEGKAAWTVGPSSIRELIRHLASAASLVIGLDKGKEAPWSDQNDYVPTKAFRCFVGILTECLGTGNFTEDKANDRILVGCYEIPQGFMGKEQPLSPDKDDVRQRLKKVGAKLIRPEFLQKRTNFDLPEGHNIEGGWLRVRDEGDKITLSLKIISDAGRDKIDNQKEICLEVNNQKEAEDLLKTIGCTQKACQESKREIWQMDDVEVCIDEWPFLEPFVEIEGESEESVKKAAAKLGFDYKDVLFFSADAQYSKKYGISEKVVNENTPKIVFNMKNPFIK